MDVVYALHPNLGGHSGLMLNMGNRLVLEMSMNQRINTKISKECEVVDVDDAISQILWAGIFRGSGLEN